MHWVIKVSYRKRNAAGEKRFFGIRVLGVMAAVCVGLAAAGMRAEPVSAATGAKTVLEKTSETAEVSTKPAADTAQEAGYGDYDYSAIDRAVRQNSGYSISFQEIINQITGEGGVTGQGIFPVLNKTFLQVITGSKTAVVQIIILALFSAAIRCFGPSACKEQISDTAQMILSISLTAVLIASFYTACTISTDTLEGCISVYKAVVPVFFSAVAFASGNVTAAVYYEIVLMLITTVNLLFKSVLIKVDQIYMLISMADAVAKEERFTKAAELCVQVMKWSGRTALVVFTGLGGLKGMLVPVSETYKKKMLYRAVQTLPGVGSSIETVTQTVWGAAKIIKNGIGMAAVIAVLIVCAVPVLKLVLMAVLFKVTAAVIEPVADKRVVKAVNALGTAVGMLLMTVLAAVSLFLLMLAMIVMMTGLQ